MNLTERFSLKHLLSNKSDDYIDGVKDCKEQVLEILDKYRNSPGVDYAIEDIKNEI